VGALDEEAEIKGEATQAAKEVMEVAGGVYLGTYSPTKWHALSTEDLKKRLQNHNRSKTCSPLSP
jgi:hypothetical protein